MKKKFKEVKCSCGCGQYYPLGEATPAGYKKISKKSIMRLTDNVIFSVGDVIQRIAENGNQFCDAVIQKIDYYNGYFYIRTETVKTSDRPTGGVNISDEETDYLSANNPNTFKFIQHTGIKKIKGNPVPSLDKEDFDFILMCAKRYISGAEPFDNHIVKMNKIKSKLQNGVETDKEQPKLSKEFQGLELAFSFAIATCLDEESDAHEEKFGRELNFWKYGKYNEDKTKAHPHQWWARPEDIKELNKLLG